MERLYKKGRKVLVMLAVAAGIMGIFIEVFHWSQGVWPPWKLVLGLFGAIFLLELLSAAWIYWKYGRYE
ncbi:MAG: hypothetical protein K6A96_09625 [Prevotella sp.]|nr:hypothetical protein [Prevotella sp.]